MVKLGGANKSVVGSTSWKAMISYDFDNISHIISNLLPSSITKGESDYSSATFQLYNPENDYIGNVAAGGEGKG